MDSLREDHGPACPSLSAKIKKKEAVSEDAGALCTRRSLNVFLTKDTCLMRDKTRLASLILILELSSEV